MRNPDAPQGNDRLTADRQALAERRDRFRLSAMARRCGLRVSKPKPDDLDGGGYRLIDLVNKRVLLGEQFDASLEEIEAFLKRERNPKKTPEELQDNRVRQLADEQGYRVRKARPQLFSKATGTYRLFHKSDPATPVMVTPDRSPTLDELEAFLRALPAGPHNRLYSPRPNGAERISHA